MFDLVAIQKSLREFGLDGWLFYDFRGANVLARRVLGLEQKPVGSRRFFYFVPAEGEPKKLVHRIETAALDVLPGEKAIYLRWQDLEAGVADLLRSGGSRRVASVGMARRGAVEPVCIARRCGNDRAGSRLRGPSGFIRQLDPAV